MYEARLPQCHDLHRDGGSPGGLPVPPPTTPPSRRSPHTATDTAATPVRQNPRGRTDVAIVFSAVDKAAERSPLRQNPLSMNYGTNIHFFPNAACNPDESGHYMFHYAFCRFFMLVLFRQHCRTWRVSGEEPIKNAASSDMICGLIGGMASGGMAISKAWQQDSSQMMATTRC